MLFVFLKLKSQTWLMTLAPLLPSSLTSHKLLVFEAEGVWFVLDTPSSFFLMDIYYSDLKTNWKWEWGWQHFYVIISTVLEERRVPTVLLVWADSTPGWWPLYKWYTCEVSYWTPLCLKCSQSPSALLRGNLSSLSPWHDFKYQETWF